MTNLPSVPSTEPKYSCHDGLLSVREISGLFAKTQKVSSNAELFRLVADSATFFSMKTFVHTLMDGWKTVATLVGLHLLSSSFCKKEKHYKCHIKSEHFPTSRRIDC